MGYRFSTQTKELYIQRRTPSMRLLQKQSPKVFLRALIYSLNHSLINMLREVTLQIARHYRVLIALFKNYF